MLNPQPEPGDDLWWWNKSSPFYSMYSDPVRVQVVKILSNGLIAFKVKDPNGRVEVAPESELAWMRVRPS